MMVSRSESGPRPAFPHSEFSVLHSPFASLPALARIYCRELPSSRPSDPVVTNTQERSIPMAHESFPSSPAGSAGADALADKRPSAGGLGAPSDAESPDEPESATRGMLRDA